MTALGPIPLKAAILLGTSAARSSWHLRPLSRCAGVFYRRSISREFEATRRPCDGSRNAELNLSERQDGSMPVEIERNSWFSGRVAGRGSRPEILARLP